MNRNFFELLKAYGSPLYVYDEAILQDRCYQMKKFQRTLEYNLPRNITVQMHYSQKANANPAVLGIVKNAGLSVDCMSPYELELGKRLFKPLEQEMLYVCNNISADEMCLVKESGVLICLDSISQVETFGKLFPNSSIMVRINPGTTGVGHSKSVVTSGKETKFGISESSLPNLFAVTKKYGLHIIGVHQHLGSLFLSDKIDDYLAGVRAGLYIIKTNFPDVSIIDLGGGFGVPYKPDEEPLDLQLLAEKLLPILIDFADTYPSLKEFKFEPGRFIPCESGMLVGTVTAVKSENGINWVGTDIGMNQLVRPSMYGSYHEISIIQRTPCPGKLNNVTVVGNICESGDILGKNRTVDIPNIGDIVLVSNTGAYGITMASNYTGRPRPAEVIIRTSGVVKLIKEAERLQVPETFFFD